MTVEYGSVLKQNENSDDSISDRPAFTTTQSSTLEAGLGIEPSFEAPPGEYEIKRRETRADVKETGPVGFWHEELSGIRPHVLKLWARTSKW
jgi:hypothetical protein